jgi:hypothetical protein
MSVFQSSTEQPSGRPPKRAHADHDVESYKRVSSKDFYVGSDADEGEVDPDHDSTIFHACSLQHRIVVAKLISSGAQLRTTSVQRPVETQVRLAEGRCEGKLFAPSTSQFLSY